MSLLGKSRRVVEAIGGWLHKRLLSVPSLTNSEQLGLARRLELELRGIGPTIRQTNIENIVTTIIA